MLEAKIARYGNSLSVRLPAALARDLDLQAGDPVSLRRVGNAVVIERSHHGRLRARLETVRESEAEIGAGRARGAEQVE